MIKFFRNIRRTHLMENKTSKYLKYAIGEIILVMVGILLALQVNNWNENRIASKKERLFLKELHEEFKKNKIQLEEVVHMHEIGLRVTNSLIALFPIDLKTVNYDSLQEYIFNTGWRYTFNPSQGIINSLVSTGDFNLISNDSLRKLIISWKDVLEDYQEEEIVAFNYVTNQLVPYLEDHFDWDLNFDDPRNDIDALTSLKFESQIKQRRNDINDILSATGELRTIRTTIDQIIELSDIKDVND